MSDRKPHHYPGAALTVTYDAGLCIHAGECVRGLPQVFDPQEKPWVKPDAASAEEIATVVARCPSGALAIAQPAAATATAGAAAAPAPVVATVVANGPLLLKGELEVLDADGNVLKRDAKAALCRCGASANRPFCDGSHKSCGFADAGVPGAISLRNEPETVTSPLLRLRVRPNGPVVAEGWLTIVDAAGQEVVTGTRATFCRCGASANKPLCDGSHNRIGFTAP